jgi:hypothetical protein
MPLLPPTKAGRPKIVDLLLLFAALLIPAKGQGQTIESLVAQANAADDSAHYRTARKLFQRAYGVSGFDPTMLALASLSAAKGAEYSIAFDLFRRAFREGFLRKDFVAYVERDLAFATFRRQPQWAPTLRDARSRIGRLDTTLRADLLEIAEQDQKNRAGIEAFIERVGRKSAQGDSATKAMTAADAPLIKRVRLIISTSGWPRRDRVGDDGAHAAWLVVQHAPSDVQRSLLPLLQRAVQKGQARASDLALLEDRVRVAQGKLQRYGSQMRSSPTPGPPLLEPIEDEPCVDRRRASVGLEPLAENLRRFGVSYTPPKQRCKSTH